MLLRNSVCALALTIATASSAQVAVSPPSTGNTVGLAIENVRVDPMVENGHAIISVTATIRNIVKRPVSPPPLRVSLLDQQNEVVARQFVPFPAGAAVSVGESRPVSASFVDPPTTARTLQIDFLTPSVEAEREGHLPG